MRPAEQAHERDRDDHDAADNHVSGPLRDRVPADREAEVVREEERGERDHDQVVEEERPAGHEPGEVVERDADEGRGAARLSDRRRPLGVRHRHDEEEHADDREHERREPERMQRDDAEREVEGGSDLSVRDRRESRRVEYPLQPWQLPCHRLVSLSPAQEGDAPDPEPDEQHPQDVAHGASARRGRLGEERGPEHDRDEPEHEHRALVEAHAARSRGGATMTRHGAWRRTKSTASPKIWRRPRSSRTRRGPAMTMISELRRIASSTMARPMFRVRAMRPITVTPYDSPIARASSSCSFASRTSSGISASSGCSSGISIAVRATIDARRSAASRHAKSIASSEA